MYSPVLLYYANRLHPETFRQQFVDFRDVKMILIFSGYYFQIVAEFKHKLPADSAGVCFTV
jgi:hypothetical protein